MARLLRGFSRLTVEESDSPRGKRTLGLLRSPRSPRPSPSYERSSASPGSEVTLPSLMPRDLEKDRHNVPQGSRSMPVSSFRLPENPEPRGTRRELEDSLDMLTMRDLVQHLRRCRAEPAVEAGDAEECSSSTTATPRHEELKVQVVSPALRREEPKEPKPRRESRASTVSWNVAETDFDMLPMPPSRPSSTRTNGF
ncbi:unnamed protein product [Effrenium voratum]|nr:unnamed protein product [Effrenium voratum]